MAMLQSQDSPRSRQPRRPRGVQAPPSDGPSPPLALSPGIGGHDQFVASKDAGLAVSAAFAGDGSAPPPGADSQLENSESDGGGKRKGWNKTSTEVVVAPVAEIGGAVMGGEGWPALSELARASAKSSSNSSLKTLTQPSVTASQEISLDALSSPKDVSSGITTPNSNGNLGPSRQKSMKRGAVGVSSSHTSKPNNDILSQAPPTQSSVVETPTNLVKSGGSVGQPFNRDAGQKGEGSYGGNEVSPRPSYRRNNSGPLFRGDGGKRDQERGKQDWINSNRRSFGSRENHGNAPRRVGARPFGPPPNAAFMPHPSSSGVVNPYVTSMVYAEMPVFYVPDTHPDSVRPMPMPMIPMFYPSMDPYLHSKIVNQIDYYFSNENLVKDTFLRKNMDNEGWVSIKLIAGFKKVMQLTDNIPLLLHSIQASNVVEVHGDKVRRKNDWFKWIMPLTETIATSPRGVNDPSQSMLAAHLNSVALGGNAAP